MKEQGAHIEPLPESGWKKRLYRIRGLIVKEFRHVFRDPSGVLIAVVLPLMLLFLFAYGISLDLTRVPIGIVVEQPSAESRDLVSVFEGSRSFPVTIAQHRHVLEPLLLDGRLLALMIIPADFQRRLYAGYDPAVQLIIRGIDANTAELVRGYVEAAWRQWWIRRWQQRYKSTVPSLLVLEPRVWFNERVQTTVALIPGSIAVIMTLIGTMLTALVVAKEWERGTIEALLTTPMTRTEFLASKFLPYFLLGLIGMGVVTVVAVGWMGIPFRGSVGGLLCLSSAFLLYALGLGMMISVVARNQFLATQAALVVGFLPSFILSGLVFAIQSMPRALQLFTYLFAPRYFVEGLRTLFLAGDIWSVLGMDIAAITILGVLFWIITVRKLPMSVEA